MNNSGADRGVVGVIIIALFALFLAQLVNGVLSISSFELTYREALISKYRILTGEFKAQVERDVNFGRPIYLLGSIDKIFDSIRAHDKDIQALYVAFPDGKILYSTDSQAPGKKLGVADALSFPARPAEQDLTQTQVVAHKKSFFISAPVYYNDAELLGVTLLEFKRSVITAGIYQVIEKNLRFFIPILLIAALSLILLLTGLNRLRRPNHQTTAWNTAVIIIVLLCAQLSYAFLNNRFFEQIYVSIFENNVTSISRSMKQDLEKVLGYGVPLARLKKAEALLEKNRISAKEAERILIADPEGRIFYAAAQTGVFSIVDEPKSLEALSRIETHETAIRKVSALNAGPESPSPGLAGYLIVLINQKLIDKQLRDLLLDILTIILVSVIFSLEFVRLSSIVSNGKPGPGADGAANAPVNNNHGLQMIRLTSFIFFFAALIPLSFLPAFFEEVYLAKPIAIWELSEKTIISLPIAAYMLGITVFIPVVGFLSNRLSVRRIFFISGGMFIIGTLMTAFAGNIIELIIARFVAGIGYGGVIINSTSMVIAATSDNNRSTGFGMWSAGFAAATICAISIGGVVVNRLGFTAGMLLAAIFALVLMVFVAIYIKPPLRPKQTAVNKERVSLSELFIPFRNRTLVVNLIFSSVPFSMAYIGLFQYVFPMYMGSINISQANIGRVLTIYGLISLATPLISRIADRIKNEKLLIIVGNSITGLSLLAFYAVDRYIGGVNPMLILIPVIFGIGFGGMMIDAVEESFITSSPEARRIGEAKLLSLYTTYDKIISIIVPLFTGILITAFGYTLSIGIIGAFTTFGVIVFALFSQNLRQLRDA